jgi:hypothetical protein
VLLPLHLKSRRAVAGAAIALLVTAVMSAAPASAATAPEVAPDAPVSDHLVPALRGAAAAEATSYVTQKFRQQSDLRKQSLTAQPASPQSLAPWSGSLHTVWGAFPNNASNGAQATHTINPDIHIPSTDPDIIYAPTLDPSGKTCIEMTTYYWNGGNAVGAFDWCDPSPHFAATRGFDSTFMSTYTTTVGGRPAYKVRDIQTNATTNSWTAYLYNFTTNAWDPFYTSANTSKLSETHGGWDMFEVYTQYNSATGEGYYCADSTGSTWAASGIQIRFGTTWQTLTTSNSNIPAPSGVNSADFGCQNLTFTVVQPNSSWKVTH